MRSRIGHVRPAVRVCGMLLRNERVLLVRQSKGDRTYWLLPGGGVERGEDLKQALCREFREEVGLEVQVDDPLGLVESISPDGGRSRHTIQIIFRVFEGAKDSGADDSTPVPVAGDPAIREIAWFAASALTTLELHPPIADLLATWMSAEGPGRFVAAGPRWVE